MDYRPPVPLEQPQPNYPAALEKTHLVGEVLIEFFVEASGDVQDVTVLRSTHPLFSAEAVQAAKLWKFKPALVNGVASRSYALRTVLEFDFK